MNLSSDFAHRLDHALLGRYTPLREFLEQIGETPLVRVPGPSAGAAIFAKCEWANIPSGTVKDRTVFGMVYRLLKATRARTETGPLQILEYTGGSLGGSLSRLCRRLGQALQLVLSDATHPDFLAELHGQGTETVLVPREQGFWGVMETAKKLAAANPSWHFLYQHENPANLWMHRETTGPEIARALPGRPDALVASIGTGGTLIGVASILAELNPELQVYATTPAEAPYGTDCPPNGLPKFLGSGGFGCGRKQPIVAAAEEMIAGHLHFSYIESLRGMRQFHAKTGLRIGSSAAANWLAACTVAASLGPRATVVTIFPSAATEYEWARCQDPKETAPDRSRYKA